MLYGLAQSLGLGPNQHLICRKQYNVGFCRQPALTRERVCLRMHHSQPAPPPPVPLFTKRSASLTDFGWFLLCGWPGAGASTGKAGCGEPAGLSDTGLFDAMEGRDDGIVMLLPRSPRLMPKGEIIWLRLMESPVLGVGGRARPLIEMGGSACEGLGPGLGTVCNLRKS